MQSTQIAFAPVNFWVASILLLAITIRLLSSTITLAFFPAARITQLATTTRQQDAIMEPAPFRAALIQRP